MNFLKVKLFQLLLICRRVIAVEHWGSGVQILIYKNNDTEENIYYQASQDKSIARKVYVWIQYLNKILYTKILTFLISEKGIAEPGFDNLVYYMFINGDYRDFDFKIRNRIKWTDWSIVLGYNLRIFGTWVSDAKRDVQKKPDSNCYICMYINKM